MTYEEIPDYGMGFYIGGMTADCDALRCSLCKKRPGSGLHEWLTATVTDDALKQMLEWELGLLPETMEGDVVVVYCHDCCPYIPRPSELVDMLLVKEAP